MVGAQHDSGQGQGWLLCYGFPEERGQWAGASVRSDAGVQEMLEGEVLGEGQRVRKRGRRLERRGRACSGSRDVGLGLF